MHYSAELRCALAICAAIAGAGFASGREVMIFFSEMGHASRAGIFAACVCLGCLVSMLMHFARKTGSRSLPRLYGSLMGAACENAVHAVYGLLMLCMSSIMLSACCELGELALPFQNSRLAGLLIGLSCGAFAARKNVLSGFGAILAPAIIVFFLAAALDTRPPDTSIYLKTARTIQASFPLALTLGAIYAFLNVSFASSVILSHPADPSKTGLFTALIMFFMLSCSDFALLRHFDALQGSAMPAVLLAARWGAAGYHICIFLLWIAVLSTLGAALSSLRRQTEALPHARLIDILLLAAASLFSLSGFDFLIRLLYPLLGWLCALLLLALLPFIERSSPKKRVKFRTKPYID